MSSIISTNKYKITLFQVGLADASSAFDDTMKLMCKASSKFIKYGSCIDMSIFDPELKSFYRKSNGYYDKSTEAINKFKLLIANIVSYAKELNGKTILVGTNLNRGFNTNHNFDSIENQKIKLIYIIDEFKKYPNVELNLVGHSQGGLVNLEAAIERNTQINKLVSISTPYAPVYLGEKLIFLDFFFKLGGHTAYELFYNDEKKVAAYKASVETLCSEQYFNNLKNKWNNLTIRPQLIVITGTSGQLYDYNAGMIAGQAYLPPTIFKYSFDGLVKFSEQANIEHANFIHLADPNLPCFNEKAFAQENCYWQSGSDFSCKRQCTLDSINFKSTVIKTLFNLIDNAINNKGIDKLDNYKVAVAIQAGLDRKIDQVPEGYEEYYNIYASDYSHKHIRTNSKTIAYLIALLN